MGDYEKLKAQILEDGVIDADEVKLLRKELYADGIIDREEANLLFALNDATSGMQNDPGWQRLFVEGIADHVLRDPVTPGVIDKKEAAYLQDKIKADGVVDANELALLVHLSTEARRAPSGFSGFVLGALKGAILEDGVIDAAEVEVIRKVIYGTGGGLGEGISRAEADFLFALNDATSGKPNHPSWRELFVEALTRHVLEDKTSPGVVDAKEVAWLTAHIQADGVVDANEKALLESIKAKAKSIAGSL